MVDSLVNSIKTSIHKELKNSEAWLNLCIRIIIKFLVQRAWLVNYCLVSSGCRAGTAVREVLKQLWRMCCLSNNIS